MPSADGPGMPRPLIPVANASFTPPIPPLVPFNAAAYANFRVNGFLVDPSYDPTNFATFPDPKTLPKSVTFGDPDVIVLDCRHALADFALGRRLYDESHVPGAFFAAVEEDLAGTKTGANGRHPLPDPERFARFLREFGVDDTTQIVAYDAGGDMFAPRLWFLARWIGHDAVAVLDGGFTAWVARGYPVTVNHAAQTEVATRIARDVAGEAGVYEMPPMMGAEDFAYMLEARPGAFIFCGNGDSAGLHHPAYNFNDEAILYGTSYWIKLVEDTLAA